MLTWMKEKETTLETYSFWHGVTPVAAVTNYWFLRRGDEDHWKAEIFKNGTRSAYPRDVRVFKTKEDAFMCIARNCGKEKTND